MIDLAEAERLEAQRYAEAFGALYDHARRSAARVVGESEDARDIAQETLARAFRIWDELGGQPWTLAWVRRVSHNLAIDVLRRRHREEENILYEPSVDAHASTLDRVEVALALESLSPRQREVVVLRYLDDLSVEDVASVLGCSESAVKTYSARGLARLRHRLIASGVVGLLIVGAIAAVFVGGRGAKQSGPTMVEVEHSHVRVRVALSATTVVSGGALVATVTLQNAATSARLIAICGSKPGVLLVTPDGDPPASAPCAGGSTNVALPPEQTRAWKVNLLATTDDGLPLPPGEYLVDVLGVDSRVFVMPVRVIVVGTTRSVAYTPSTVAPSARGGSSANPAGHASWQAPAGHSSAAPTAEARSSRAPAHNPPETQSTAPANTSPEPTVGSTTPVAVGLPSTLLVQASFRTQADHMDATRDTVSWTLSIKNTSDVEINETFVTDIVTVITPDGITHADIQASLPNISMRIPPHQTVSERIPLHFGQAPFVDGGVVTSPPALGSYFFTFVFVDSQGARTPATARFLLRVQ